MIPCPGCGAGMHFDIESQMLKCSFCGSTQEVTDAADDRSAKPDTMDVTVFTCPQCGGEIFSTENEASSFCTFCGASVMLEGRMTEAKRPLRIVPFKKTKDDCKEAYRKLTKRAWFTPKELKDPEYLEKFRGIYLPFWNYSFSQKGPVKLTATREDGNYKETLSLTCDLDASYDGISYDASSAFNDELCKEITPFNTSSVKDFHPGYMSGFFSDSADVDSEVYLEDARRDANEQTIKKLEKEYGGVHIEREKAGSSRLHTQHEGTMMAMYPVWFLTWRSKDRVAYAVVNGETGKIAADLPVQKSRYLLGSLILAIPIFLLLTLMPVITAPTMLLVASILSFGTFLIYWLNTREIRNREYRTDDKGYQSKLGNVDAYGKISENAGKIAPVGAKRMENGIVAKLRAYCVLAAGIAGIGLYAMEPVSDVYYYGGAIVVFACICFTLLGLIDRFNMLSTRPIPQFHNREGGEEK